MEERLEQVAVAKLEGRPDAYEGNLGVLGAIDGDNLVGQFPRVEPLDVDTRDASQRQRRGRS